MEAGGREEASAEGPDAKPSYYNPTEARLAAALVARLLATGSLPNGPSDIGVITPYSAQVHARPLSLPPLRAHLLTILWCSSGVSCCMCLPEVTCKRIFHRGCALARGHVRARVVQAFEKGGSWQQARQVGICHCLLASGKGRAC